MMNYLTNVMTTDQFAKEVKLFTSVTTLSIGTSGRQVRTTIPCGDWW